MLSVPELLTERGYHFWSCYRLNIVTVERCLNLLKNILWTKFRVIILSEDFILDLS